MSFFRWTPIHITFIESDETVRLEPRDGDIVRVEEMTGRSYSALVNEDTLGVWFRTAWVVLRRMKDPRASVDFYDFLDSVVLANLGDKEATSPEANPTDLAPPTGESSNSHSLVPAVDSKSVLVSS